MRGLRQFIHKKILFAFIFLNTLCLAAQCVKDDTSVVSDTALQKVLYFRSSKYAYLIDTLYKMENDFNDAHYFMDILHPYAGVYQSLSSLGSPAYNLQYKNGDILDYQWQKNVFDPYIFKQNTVKYFQTSKAYTSFSYANGLDKGQYLNVNFTKNLYQGLNLQTEYNVNYSEGEFQHSQVRNQFFNITLNYLSPQGQYRSTFAFVHNRALVQENGGILADSLFLNESFSSAATYPVNSLTAWSKWKSNEFYFTQALLLNRNLDKQRILNSGALVHSTSFERYARLYDDSQIPVYDSLGTTLCKNSLFWTNDVYSKTERLFLPIALGVNYDFISFQQQDKQNFSTFSPQVKFSLENKYYRIFDLSYTHTLSTNRYNNDYQLEMSIPSLVVGRGFNSSLSFFAQSRQVDYIFDTEDKTQTKSVSLFMSYKQWGRVELNYFDIRNLYFFSSDEAVSMANSDVSLYQAVARSNFSLNPFTFRGMYVLQKSSNSKALSLPALAIKQGIYWDFVLFSKKLYAQLGLDINYLTSYNADVYIPNLGVFASQSHTNLGNYVFADLYFNMKIERFTLFLTLNHPYAGIFSRNYFSTPLYPHQGLTLRYGFSWKFLD